MLKSFLAICLFLALCTPLAAQSPAFQQEGIATDYQFTVDGEPLEVSWQMILKRGQSRTVPNVSTEIRSEAYHLEIATGSKELVSERYTPRYDFSFYDQNNKLLFSRRLRVERFDPMADDVTVGETNFYRVNLLSLPLAIFDLTHRIDIVVRQ